MDDREIKLRAEYYDGPASDSMSLPQFFMRNGFDPKKVKKKMSKGGIVPKYKDGGLVSKRKMYT